MSVPGALLGLAGLAVAIVLLARRRKNMPEPTICLPAPDLPDPPPVFPDPPPADAPERSSEEIAAALDEAAAKHKPTLQWRTSIVDLCKAAGVDSSKQNRALIAKQAGMANYSPTEGGDEAQNIELHKHVLAKLRDPKFGGLLLR